MDIGLTEGFQRVSGMFLHDMHTRSQVDDRARTRQCLGPVHGRVTQGQGMGRRPPMRHEGPAHKAIGAGDHQRGGGLRCSVGWAHQENSRAFLG